jgi:hypothetical protein
MILSAFAGVVNPRGVATLFIFKAVNGLNKIDCDVIMFQRLAMMSKGKPLRCCICTGGDGRIERQVFPDEVPYNDITIDFIQAIHSYPSTSLPVFGTYSKLQKSKAPWSPLQSLQRTAISIDRTATKTW